jgi:hypothetical protein
MGTRRGMRPLAVAGLLAVLGPAPATRAEEKVIPVDQVPGAVISAARARFPGAKIRQATEEAEDGKPVFSLEMEHQRHDLDVTFRGDGTVVLAETAVPKKELPRAVLRAVARKYPGASVRGAGSVRKGPEVKKAADYYEFYLWTADNKPALVKVDPKGKVLEDPNRRVRRTQPRPPQSPVSGPPGSMTLEDW